VHHSATYLEGIVSRKPPIAGVSSVRIGQLTYEACENTELLNLRKIKYQKNSTDSLYKEKIILY
jgi:hypothetical protein